MFCYLWDLLELDNFWAHRLGLSRKGTCWLNVLKTLVCYRMLDPGSEFRLHRLWFDGCAIADLLGEGVSLGAKNTLYRCLDHLEAHREELFVFLRKRWEQLFQTDYEVLLYDLTSTYFESDPPTNPSKKRFGYSRDKRFDCVQVVIALVLTAEGLPLYYKVYPGNTQDKSTLEEMINAIEKRYGKAKRTWLMDRGIPTEETLELMRKRGANYLVGTPKGKLSKLASKLLEQPWHQARCSVQVKLLEEKEEFYVYVQSKDRILKERSMRQKN